MTLFEVKKIKLYQMGVGWLSAKSEISGKEVLFPILAKNQDDFLKTFHVHVEGDGMLTSVSFDTEVNQETKIDYDGNALLSIINLLAGSEAEIELFDGTKIKGIILGYQEMYVDEEEATLNFNITIIDEEQHIHHIPDNKIKTILPQNDYLLKMIKDQLELLSKSKGEEEKSIRIAFDKEGKKIVTVSYVAELPAWQSSYRFYILGDDSILFEHWGQVCNTTPQDWIDAEIELLTGLPISFKIDMSSPYIIERPRIERPKKLGISVMQPEVEYAEKEKVYPARAPAKRMMKMAAEPMAPPSPSPASETLDQLVTGAIESAEIVEAGESISFAIKQAISLKKGESAFLLLDSQTLPAERKLIYNQSNHPLHPFDALEVENKTLYSWSAGPATIYDNLGYAGEALINRVPKGEKYLVPFALNQDITVKQSETTKREKIGVGLNHEYYIEHYQTLRIFDFEINNASDTEKKLFIEIPKIYGFKVDSKRTKVKLNETANYFRIPITIAPKSMQREQVTLVRVDAESISLASVNDDILEQLLSLETINDKQKKILEQIKAKRFERNSINGQLEATENKIERIENTIQQVQESLKVLSDKGEEAKIRARYVEKLNSAFEEAEKTRENIESLTQKLSQLDMELEELLNSL